MVTAFTAGCHESQFTKFNEAPTAKITIPQTNTEKHEGENFEVQGQVGDQDDPIEELRVTWYKGDEFGAQCVELVPADNGQTRCDFAIGSESQEITLEVVDPSGKQTWDVITVVSIPAQGPEIIITAPEDGDVYAEGTAIPLKAVVNDEEDVESALSCEWTDATSNNGEGDDTADTVIVSREDIDVPDNGQISNYVSHLEAGNYILRLKCSDTTGRDNYADVSIEVEAQAGPPTVEITGPPSGHAFNEEALVQFAATVDDPDDEFTTLNISWTSSLDGEVDNTPCDANGDIQFATDQLSIGLHEVTLTVTDEMDHAATDAITIEITALEGSDTGL